MPSLSSDAPSQPPAPRKAAMLITVGAPHPISLGPLVATVAGAAVLLDGVALVRGPSSLATRAALLVVVAALAAIVAMLAWLVLRALAWIGERPRVGPPARALAGALVWVGIALLVVRPDEHVGAPAYYVATFASGLFVWGVGFFVPRLEPRAPAVAVGALAFAFAAALDWAMDITMYSEFHAVAHAMIATSLVGMATRSAFASFRTRLAWLPVALVALVVACALVADRADPLVRRVGVAHGRWFATLGTTLALPLDSDGDGASPWLWGGDCDDGDASIYPGAPDPIDDGEDRNCNGVVDVTDSPARRGLGAALGEPCYAADSVDRVVFLVLDTFRPELLRPDVMPSTYAYLAQGTRFARTYANATSTTLSMPYFVRPQHDAPDVREAMRAAGIATVDDPDVARVLARLEAAGPSRMFARIHRMELHDPYVMWPDTPRLPDLAPLSAAYVAEAWHLDHVLAPLLAWLARPEIAARSLVVITGDHGEGAGEHGMFGHTRASWEEVVRVPLGIRGPELALGSVDALTTTRSIPSTFLGAFGMCAEARQAERFGRSLLRARTHAARAGQRFVVVETSRAASGRVHRGAEAVVVTAEGLKLTIGLHDGVFTAFDLIADPRERRDLAFTPDPRPSAMVRAFVRAEDLGVVRPLPTRPDYLRRIGH